MAETGLGTAEPTGALAEGTETLTMTRAELQAQLDRARTEAAKTREANVRKESVATLESLQAELAAIRAEAERKQLQLDTNAKLREADALDVLPFIDRQLDTVEARLAYAKDFKAAVEAAAARLLDQRLKTAPGAPPAGLPAEPKPIDRLTPAEWKARKAAMGLN